MTDSDRNFSWLKMRKRKRLPLRLGVKPSGGLEVLDLSSVHALLLTGPTGCGKSVAVHTLIDSLMGVKNPKDVKLLLIDGKGIEFTNYEEGLPFLLALPVSCDAVIRASVQWLSREIEKRLVRHSRVGEAPDIVVVVDGMVFAWDALAEVESEFWYCLEEGKAAGVHFIITSQSAAFATGHEASFPCRLQMSGTGRMRGSLDGREIDVVGEDLGDEPLDNVYGRHRTLEPSLLDFVNGEILKRRCKDFADGVIQTEGML